ncbi:hypothetical protein [Hydrogenophaga sp. RWCD_12]|uniref:hypothetical protein n=1 Tax=Hydrogenophaga sp. RWCD_12 TaxID=3391190 RepID=UPI00398471FE
MSPAEATMAGPATMACAIPAAVEATLDRMAPVLPVSVASARAALESQLGAVGRSVWPEVAWRFSRLTNTGLPIEFAWSSRETALRYTVEVAPPEAPDAGRLPLAARQLDWPDDPLPAMGPWLALQQERELRFGAWLGARFSSTGQATKLYAELPHGAALPPVLIAAHPWLRGSSLHWRMAGLNADRTLELYAQSADLDRTRLLDLAQSLFGTPVPGAALSRHLDLLSGGQDLPRPSGLSVVFDGDLQPRALTWFCFAKAVFRDDEQVRQTLLSAVSGTTAKVYAALANGPADGRWRHGMVGAGVDAGGSVWLQCGLRPT